MSNDIEWTLVPVDRVTLVYADGRYVGEIGRSVFARHSRRWWASTGWEPARRRFPNRAAALASVQEFVGPGPDRGTVTD